MKSRLRQHHHGNEIRVDAAYITLPGSDKTELGATATISRDGATVHTINAKSEDDAFERAWCWSCVNRAIRIYVDGDLVSRYVHYFKPGATHPVKIYTAMCAEEAEAAAETFRKLLAEQWERELAEHMRRRDGLPARLAVLRADISEVEAEIEPLKTRLKMLRADEAAAPREVYEIDIPDNVVEDLGALMSRKVSFGPSIAELLADDEDSANEKPEAEEPPAKGKRKPKRPGKDGGK